MMRNVSFVFKILLLMMMCPLAVLAGPKERAYLKESLNPKIAEAEAKFKKSCGCATKISVDLAALKTEDEMTQARNTAQSIVEEVAGSCTDKESKAAICAMKALKIGKAADTSFSYTRGTGTASTDGQSYVTWSMISKELDK